MSAQVHSVPGQTEGGRNTFLEWTSIILSSKLSLTCGSNVNYYKSVDHPIPILPDRIWNTQVVFKANQYALLLVECPGMFSFWPKWRGEEGRFWRVQEGDHIVRLPPGPLGCHKRWNVFPFVRLEIILPLLCFLLDPLTISTAGNGFLW